MTSPDRVLVDGVTKAAALEYFLAVGDGILGALRDRPVMLERRRDDTVFFQRRLPQGAPEWVATVRGTEYDLVCPDDLATVAWMVNLGAVTFHPWPVRRDAMHTPDRLLIDLDPQAGTGFEEAVAVARMVREVLHERELEGFPKTSGGRGLHILVPLATPQPVGRRAGAARGDRSRGRRAHPRTRDDARGSNAIAGLVSISTAARRRSPRRTRSAPAASSRHRCAGRSSTSCRRGTSTSPRCQSGSPGSETSRREADARQARRRHPARALLRAQVGRVPRDRRSRTATRSRSTAATPSRWHATSRTSSRPSGRHLPERCTVDGEIVVITERRLDFFALQQRVHPAASRVDRLAAETPASFIAFDLLREGEEDLMGTPFRDRRAALERVLAAAPPPIHLTPITRDEATAREWFEHFEGAGLDGIIAKDGAHPYRPNVRTMFKVKHQRTADCVVCGYRIHKTAGDAIGSLLLGLYADGDKAPRWAEHFGGLLPIGATASFPMARRKELLVELRPLEIDRRRPPVGRRTRPRARRQPLEPRARGEVRPARPGARRRGPLRPHGRRLPAPPGHVPALAGGPRRRLVWLRPARDRRRLRRRRDPVRLPRLVRSSI